MQLMGSKQCDALGTTAYVLLRISNELEVQCVQRDTLILKKHGDLCCVNGLCLLCNARIDLRVGCRRGVNV